MLLPVLAITASVSSALGLGVLVFLFSDPSGAAVGAMQYAAAAVVLGLVGGAGAGLARRSLRATRPLRRLCLTALWVGIGGVVGAAAFLLFALAAPPFARWLVFG
jgi:hypothetical protein